MDASSGSPDAAPGFYFLPPLVNAPTITDTFDPNYLPAMSVCELDGNPSASVNPDWASVKCTNTVVTYFPPGTATVSVENEQYQFSWDTDASPENLAPMDPDKFYRIQILLDNTVLGYLDINPQNPAPDTPGEDYPDLLAFRIGSNLPVKFFMSPSTQCATAEGYVIQCIATAVFDATGGVLSLEPDEPGWSKLSVVLPANALPDGVDQVTLTMERIDPDLFFQTTGQTCIPFFDAPQAGDCLRVSTDPILTAPLVIPANVELCVDPYSLVADPAQASLLQIIRYDDGGTDTGNGQIQALPSTAATTCDQTFPSPSQVGLLPVPKKDGLLRKMVVGVNTVARALGPEKLAAGGEIRLAGATSNFSRFRNGLPGEMTKESGDNTVIQQQESGATDYDVQVTVKVVDADGGLVEGATVHFENGSDVTTGADGLASTTWTVPSSPGVYTFDATALGLLDTTVPDNTNLINFQEATVTFTATVVGEPVSYTQSPTGTLSGAPGSTLSSPLVITVYDENGNPVSGWDVTWTSTCDATGCTPGTLTGDSQTGTDGSASGTWTLSTTPGGNTATAQVGGVTATWNANGVCQVTIDGTMSPGEWDCAQVRTFSANISGGSTPAEVYWQNDGTNLYMAVRVMQSSLDKVNNLRLDFDNDGLGTADAGDDAIEYDADALAFSDMYLTAKCANSNQAGCGALDKVSQDGAGAVGNNGTWTVYEVSHPLAGTPGEDFIRSAGQNLGFFLTLRVGNGAQGNTQWPGFRVYQQMTIH